MLIASVMAAFNEEDWKTLTMNAVNAGADALELNLSCPHAGVCARLVRTPSANT